MKKEIEKIETLSQEEVENFIKLFIKKCDTEPEEVAVLLVESRNNAFKMRELKYREENYNDNLKYYNGDEDDKDALKNEIEEVRMYQNINSYLNYKTNFKLYFSYNQLTFINKVLQKYVDENKKEINKLIKEYLSYEKFSNERKDFISEQREKRLNVKPYDFEYFKLLLKTNQNEAIYKMRTLEEIIRKDRQGIENIKDGKQELLETYKKWQDYLIENDKYKVIKELPTFFDREHKNYINVMIKHSKLKEIFEFINKHCEYGCYHIDKDEIKDDLLKLALERNTVDDLYGYMICFNIVYRPQDFDKQKLIASKALWKKIQEEKDVCACMNILCSADLRNNGDRDTRKEDISRYFNKRELLNFFTKYATDEQIDDFMASMSFSYQHGTFNQTTPCDYTNDNGEIELC